MGVAKNDSNAACIGQPETVLHALRDCSPASFFWSRRVPPSRQHSFFSSNLRDWLRENILSKDSMATGMDWSAFFCTACWLIWKNRSTACFEGMGAALSPHSLEHAIMAKTKLWHDAWNAPSRLPSNRQAPADRVLAQVGWTPPPEGWLSLHVDGASSGNPGPAGAGGVLRDSSGRWVAGFVANLGAATAALSELWAISYGLDIARKAGCSFLQVASDSQLAIQLISTRQDPIHPYATLLTAIRRKIGSDWVVRIAHTYREGNRVADWLSKHSLVYPYGMHELADPPNGVTSILRDDMLGTTFERRIITSSTPPL
ncbi:unnamed protein product [Linum trigynum]|uniref:RNase H type-1 domain-containing protein n=1 Tax=Linum trigynum TaxID=586398 RepID=A0AAV2CJ95_9ROSI